MSLGSKTVLAHVIERCHAITGIDAVCCAIPDGLADNVVAAEAWRAGAQVFRGAEADVLERYWRASGLDRERHDEAAILVGLLLRGWRKGYDAEAGITLASGVTAADDLAWWCERALEAADRIL